MQKPVAYSFPPYEQGEEQPMRCCPNILIGLLISQWKRLTRQEIEATHYQKRLIARLIERKYGINSLLAENYLSNLERTLELAA